jgi:hypothetical protein
MKGIIQSYGKLEGSDLSLKLTSSIARSGRGGRSAPSPHGIQRVFPGTIHRGYGKVLRSRISGVCPEQLGRGLHEESRGKARRGNEEGRYLSS